MDPNELVGEEIYKDRSFMKYAIAFSIFMICVGIVIYFYDGSFSVHGHFFTGRSKSVFSICCVSVFALLFYRYSRELINNNPELVIHNNFVVVYPPLGSRMRIDRDNISGLKSMQTHGSRFIMIMVHDYSQCMILEYSLGMRMMMRFNKWIYGPCYPIATQRLQMDHNQLIRKLSYKLNVPIL